MSTEATPTKNPIATPHADLEHSLRRLLGLRAEYAATRQMYETEIAEMQRQIETQAFAVFPGIQEECAYWDGDPIQFLAGCHQVRVYHNDGAVEVEIDRTHLLEIEGDLFAEEVAG